MYKKLLISKINIQKYNIGDLVVHVQQHTKSQNQAKKLSSNFHVGKKLLNH